MDRRALLQAVDRHAPAAAIHLAARSDVAQSVREPGLYRENIDGADAIAWGFREIPVVLASSAAVYGQGGEATIDETAALKPINPYGLSKVGSEVLLPRAMRLRFFNVAGGSGDLGNHILPRALAALTGGPALILNGPGDCVRDFIHVQDVAGAVLQATLALIAGEPGQAINICSGKGVSIADLLARCGELARRPVPIAQGPAREGDPLRLVGANDLARRALFWAPRHGLDDIVLSALTGEI